MSKTVLSPACRVYPAPVVIVSCGNEERSNLITCAWSGSINLEPPMAYVSIRRDRFSHAITAAAGEFVINLCTEEMARAADICGACSGRDTDKWAASGLTQEKASAVSAPTVKESPLSLECRVVKTVSLGTHDMFLGEIVAIDADESLLDEHGRLRPERAALLGMAGGSYLTFGEKLQNVGFSMRSKD